MNLFRKAKPSLSSRLSRYRNPLPKTPTPRPKPPPSPPPPPPHQHRHSTPLSRQFLPAGWRRNYHYYYYVDNRQLEHFRRRGGPRWYHNPRVVLFVAVVGGAAAVTVYYGHLETVPYTKRTHFILLSPSLERQLGESQFEQLKVVLRDKILPPLPPRKHPCPPHRQGDHRRPPARPPPRRAPLERHGVRLRVSRRRRLRCPRALSGHPAGTERGGWKN